MKAHFKYCDATGDGVAWYRLTDLVRATIEYPELDTMYGGLRSLVRHFGKDVREFNDRYQVRLREGVGERANEWVSEASRLTD